MILQNQSIDSSSSWLWLNWYDRLLSMENKSKSTRLSYISALKHWCALVSSVESPSKADLYLWLRDRRNNVGQSRLNQEIYAIKGFYSRAFELFLIKENHTNLFPKQRRADKKLPKTINEWQIGNLLAAPDLKKPVGFRDMCIMRLIFETGMKGNELILLTISDFYPDKRLINIPGKRMRIVPISADMNTFLLQWIELRRSLKPGKGVILFVSSRGRPISTSRRIWRICARYAPAMGSGFGVCDIRGHRQSVSVWGAVGPNTFRNSFITAMHDIRFIQALLGLSSAADLLRYLPVDIETLKREHAKHFKPLSGATSAHPVDDSDPS